MSAQFFAPVSPVQTIESAPATDRERRAEKGNSIMSTHFKHLLIALLALFASLFGANAASANTGLALAKLEELGRISNELKGVENQLSAFTVRSYYCLPPGSPTKASAQTALQQIYDRSNQLSNQARRARAVLVRIIANDQRARSAVDKKIDGGSGVIIDGSFFRGINNQVQANRTAHSSKLAELNAAPTRRCVSAPAPRQAIAIIDPLFEVPTSLDFDAIPSPNVPDKFCHEDEKRELMDRLIGMRQKALANSSEAAALAERLQTLQREITANLAATRTKASKAAHDNDNFALKAHTDQIRKYTAALSTLTDAIARARRQEREWMDAELRLDGVYKRVRDVPVVDCTDANLKPANALPGKQFGGFGAAPDLRPVEIPAIPDKVCTEEEKQEIIAKSFTALQNAWHNRDAWNARLDAINKLLKKASATQVQQLTNARNEARRESAKWIRIVSDATDANNKALALNVDDCDGLTKTGKTASALPGVHSSVPEADSLPYDLPNVPEFVCTWDEKQALIKRAEAARAAASHNHRQWSARANALGDLLYGDNKVSTGRAKLLRAHAEARAQSDHWATQMLDTAPKAYWKARNLEIRDCAKDKKTSMSTGGAGDLNKRINRVRGGAPVYNGGEQPGGYGVFGGHRRLADDQGFDGSEAENALDHTLDDVRKHRKHKDDNAHPYNDDSAGSSGHVDGNWKPSVPKLPAFDDKSKTPVHPTSEPEPKTALNTPKSEPKPTTGSSETYTPKTSDPAPVEPTENGGVKMTDPNGVVIPPKLDRSKFDGVSLGTRNQTPKSIDVGPAPTINYGDAGNNEEPIDNGGWRQIAPPALVITPQGGSAYDYDGSSLYPMGTTQPTDSEAAAVENELAGQ